jgi:uncharacterized cupin superfamily protein
VIVLSGEMEIETSAGDIRRFRPGDILLADDMTGSGHFLRCLTDVTTLLGSARKLKNQIDRNNAVKESRNRYARRGAITLA